MARLLRSLLGLGFFCAWIFSAGCNSAGNQPASNPRPPESSAAASLRPGDTLVVAIQGVPDPTSNNVQIDDKGFITLPYIGNVEAAQSTTATLSEKIRQTYLAKKIYNALDVSVTVTERYVYVGGEVVRPGRVIWTPDLTVAKAIQAAGGFTLYAREGRVSLVRDRNAYTISVPLAQRNPNEDPRLIPGDAIQVPKSAF